MDHTVKEKTEQDFRNGYNVTALSGLVNVLKDNSQGGRVTFISTSKWLEGAKSITRFSGYKIDGQLQHETERSFEVLSDEPLEFGATDTAPAPPEQLLAAIGSCIAATGNAYAALSGIRLKRFDVSLESEIDLHGMFALDKEVRPGIRAIRAKITVEGDAGEEELREIAKLGYQYSLVRETVENGVSIEPDIQIV